MKVIFLSIGGFKSILDYDQYPDLLREFQKNGHEVYIVCSNEKKMGLQTQLLEENNAKILRVKIGNITQSSLIEKGVATIKLGKQYKNAINKYFKSVKFDLILYTTPPITLYNVVKFIKSRDKAFTYLILKDIFPQNAVDLNLIDKKGFKSFIYKYFRKKEKDLYNISDKIGTMSLANSEYIIKHNPDIEVNRIEVCPNCLDIRTIIIDLQEKNLLRKKYNIPINKRIFVYGGNLGKPQDIPFIIKCIKACYSVENAYFWIIGNGTEYKVLEDFISKEHPCNLKLSKRLPKEEYDRLIASCDVGLVFLDHRFTIPNFPSRMLTYMQAGLPVFACTDVNTDIGKVITNGGFGWWTESNNPLEFKNIIEKIAKKDLTNEINNTRKALLNYSVDNCYKIILNSKIAEVKK